MKDISVKQPENNSFSVESLIAQAIQASVPVETMEKLMAMRRELREEYAKEQYDRAMAAFQGECPIIMKTKKVRTNSGVEAYSFAPLETIVDQVKPLLQKNGFSYSVQTETLENGVRSDVIVTHVGGHSCGYGFSTPLGAQTNIMSRPQVVAATLTFCKRQAFNNAFGIMTADEDTDSKKSDDVDQEKLQEAIDSISESKTLEELKTAYTGLGKMKLVKSVIIAKDKRKQELTQIKEDPIHAD